MDYEVIGYDEDGDPIEQAVQPEVSTGRYYDTDERALRYAESCDGFSCGDDD